MLVIGKISYRSAWKMSSTTTWSVARRIASLLTIVQLNYFNKPTPKNPRPLPSLNSWGPFQQINVWEKTMQRKVTPCKNINFRNLYRYGSAQRGTLPPTHWPVVLSFAHHQDRYCFLKWDSSVFFDMLFQILSKKKKKKKHEWLEWLFQGTPERSLVS